MLKKYKLFTLFYIFPTIFISKKLNHFQYFGGFVNSFSGRFFWLFFFIFCGFLFYLLRPILTPFLCGAFLAYLGDPLADKLAKLNFSRNGAVITVFVSFTILMLVVVLFLIPTINSQISNLMLKMPEYLEWIKSHTGDTLLRFIGIENGELNSEKIQAILKNNLGDSSKIASFFVGSIQGSFNILFTLTLYIFLIPVVTFYLLRDWDILIAKINSLIPKKHLATVRTLAIQSDTVLAGFMRGQFSVMMALGIIYSVGLSIIGLDMAIAIGMFAGMVSFVPYLGLIIGICLAGIMALLQFQDWLHLLEVVVVFGIAQIMETVILTPKFIGDKTGLHPVAVLFAVMAGGQLFGFTGILIGLPAAAVINVFLLYFKDKYLASDIYNQQEITTPTKSANKVTNKANKKPRNKQ